MKIRLKNGKIKTIKHYTIGVSAYKKKGYVRGLHNKTGKVRYFKTK